jgi:hypothetical protein
MQVTDKYRNLKSSNKAFCPNTSFEVPNTLHEF